MYPETKKSLSYVKSVIKTHYYFVEEIFETSARKIIKLARTKRFKSNIFKNEIIFQTIRGLRFIILRAKAAMLHILVKPLGI